ncbi:MFS transporter [Chloroflexota bacterium]
MNNSKQIQAKQVLPISSMVTFVGFLDTHLLIPVMALYAYELGASVGIIGLIIGLYSITNTPANIIFGRLIDKVGYRVPLIIGLIGSALNMLLYSACRLPVHLALVRVAHGVTGGMIGPATMSIMADYGKRAQKGRAMGFYGISLGSATLVGYGLSGVIASRLGYKAVFSFGAIMLVLGAILSLSLPRARGNDGIEDRTSTVEISRHPVSLLKRRGLVVAYGSIFAQYVTFGGVVTLLPLYVSRLGMEAFHVGILLATFAIMFIILQFVSGPISDNVGRLIPTAVGLSLSIVALVILPSVAAFPLLALVMALYGTAYGILFPSISALIADHTNPDERGTATGIFHALLTTGVAIGAPIMGWAGGTFGIETGLVLSSGIMVIALVVALTAIKT